MTITEHMMQWDLSGDLKRSPKWNEITNGVREGFGPFAAFGVGAQICAAAACTLKNDLSADILVLTASEESAQRLYEDVSALDPSALLFPARPVELRPISAHSAETAHARVRALYALHREGPRVVIASAAAALGVLAPPDVLFSHAQTLSEGMRLDVDAFLGTLARAGYERVERVEGPGQAALRGGILDIFAVGETLPVRAELFGDAVESLRSFDAETQRSVAPVKRLDIVSACEAPVTEASRARALPLMERALAQSGLSGMYAAALEMWMDSIAALQPPENAESCIPLFYDAPALLLDYLRPGWACLLSEPGRIRQHALKAEEEFAEYFDARMQEGAALPEQRDLVAGWDTLVNSIDASRCAMMQLLPSRTHVFPEAREVHMDANPVPVLQGAELAAEVRRLLQRDFSVWLFCGTHQRVKRVQDMLMDERVTAVALNPGTAPGPGRAGAAPASLGAGFILEDARLAVITEAEIFGARKKKRRPIRSVKAGLEVFADLNVGDYVVHDVNGIGVFKGMEQLTVDGVCRDYLLIQYAGNDRLYVPSEQLGHVQKYVGSEHGRVRLSKLGTSEWSRTKARVSESVRALAIDLIGLYARRRARPGHAFPPDTQWQREFEDNFAFEETEDQIQSIREIKADMERPFPMDRLLCGDVGYGKTEVAMRAAFKAVADSTQVAVLVPTTVLAQQHFHTFTERFNGFPVTIETLSRFKPPREQKRIVERIKEGTVDIVIGTHRLLGKDVAFKNLGLLVVDEEQRFGVAHKEAIKTLKENVDVLMLSATPIPRTLHMSLSGIRDMSTLISPPEERFPVQTFVLEYSDTWAREVILREVARNGQVYFVYNHVKDIERFLFRLHALMPGVRIGVAHGQMRESQLEKVMIDFYAGGYDVLLCSTIIESGLDIPNVNSIIVYDADHLGLAQLYQLRGRVGRSNRHAFAYFTFRRDKVISEVAEKRLMAIREFTEFGAGFKIAMRDLEIRGAGNILGPQQHGHMSEVGYDMYWRLIDKAVRELQGEKVEERVNTTMDVAISAFIPPGYIGDDHQKIEAYKRIAAIESREEASALTAELRDRFGEPPESVLRLFDIALIKSMCMRLHVDAFLCKDGFAQFKFHSEAPLDPGRLVRVLERYRRVAVFSATQPPQIMLRRKALTVREMLEFAERFAAELIDCVAAK